MDRIIYYVSLAGLLSVAVGCGKFPFTGNGEDANLAGQSYGTADMLNLEQQIEQQASASTGYSAVNGRGVDNPGSQMQSVQTTFELLLDRIYGTNSSVSRVAILAGGSQFTKPNSNGNYPAGAISAIFDKDQDGKFKLSSGNPGQVGSIPYSALYLFLARGIVPVAAGGAGFCAGIPGQAYQSGAAVLGLGISSQSGKPLGFAGALLRTGNSYQACSVSSVSSGCTAVTNVPAVLTNQFPACKSVL